MKPKTQVIRVPTAASEPKPPSEEEVTQANVDTQRRVKKRSMEKGGRLSTVLSNYENKLG